MMYNSMIYVAKVNEFLKDTHTLKYTISKKSFACD